MRRSAANHASLSADLHTDYDLELLMRLQISYSCTAIMACTKSSTSSSAAGPSAVTHQYRFLLDVRHALQSDDTDCIRVLLQSSFAQLHGCIGLIQMQTPKVSAATHACLFCCTLPQFSIQAALG